MVDNKLTLNGRDLIVYILENDLLYENMFDENGVFVGFADEEDTAFTYDVGVATIKAYYDLGVFKGVKIGDKLYFLRGKERGNNVE